MSLFRILAVRKLFLLSLVLSLIIIYFLFGNNTIDDVNRTFRLKKIDEIIKTQAKSIGCKQPDLPVNAPELMKFFKVVPKIDCSNAGDDWVKCIGSNCIIQEIAKIKYGPIKCSFSDILRLNDYKTYKNDPVQTETFYPLEKSDVVFVSCTSPVKEWSATLTGIRLDSKVWETTSWDFIPDDAIKLNVLMFGFDSLSRNTFIRKLPRSYEYLTKILNAIVLKGYNIVGDGTPQALIPILTGKTELELPDTRKRLKNTKYVDSYPFIWNDYKEAGYVTAFFEDVPELSTFTYRLNGFDKPPTDHYMRPYYLASLDERKKWPHLCTGDQPRHKIMLNAVSDFFTVYKNKPKFLFGFHGELSHDDYNLIGVADDDLLEFLTNLNESGALNNTILVMMADHGHRFAEIRNTIQGKQEERLPFFSFTFPKWFQWKYKDVYKNFQSNTDKLVTPFDIHRTLKSVLHLDNVKDADINERSVSLFTKIPSDRSCAHAYIEPHWCACLDWHHIPITDSIVDRLSTTLVTTINNYTQTYRYLCEYLHIAQIYWVTKMAPNEHLVKFNKNADIDGFVADLTANTRVNYDMYQIKVMLKPGDSLFEASIKHILDKDKMELKISDISRINMYGRQARCVEQQLPYLRKYCFCKDDL